MTTTFETAKVGDRVWCMKRGWGEVREVKDGGGERWGGDTNSYPIDVSFPSGERETYTLGGLCDDDDISQTLFWDEVVIEAPVKSMPDLPVDTKVLVWDRDGGEKKKRYFSHYGFNGRVICFNRGHTSWFGDKNLKEWANWELAE